MSTNQLFSIMIDCKTHPKSTNVSKDLPCVINILQVAAIWAKEKLKEEYIIGS